MLAIAGIFYELQLVTGNLYSALALLTQIIMIIDGSVSWRLF